MEKNKKHPKFNFFKYDKDETVNNYVKGTAIGAVKGGIAGLVTGNPITTVANLIVPPLGYFTINRGKDLYNLIKRKDKKEKSKKHITENVILKHYILASPHKRALIRGGILGGVVTGSGLSRGDEPNDVLMYRAIPAAVAGYGISRGIDYLGNKAIQWSRDRYKRQQQEKQEKSLHESINFVIQELSEKQIKDYDNVSKDINHRIGVLGGSIGFGAGALSGALRAHRDSNGEVAPMIVSSFTNGALTGLGGYLLGRSISGTNRELKKQELIARDVKNYNPDVDR